jgi:hypothetical protein
MDREARQGRGKCAICGQPAKWHASVKIGRTNQWQWLCEPHREAFDPDPAFDPHLGPDEASTVKAIFRQHGYSGDLMVIDESPYEVVFLVPAKTRVSLQRDLEARLGDLLHRMVHVAETSEAWSGQGHAVE